MNLEQTAALLILIEDYDRNPNKKFTPDSAKSWQRILGDLDADAAAAAVVEHYRSSRFPIMPADIIDGAGRLFPKIERERLQDHIETHGLHAALAAAAEEHQLPMHNSRLMRAVVTAHTTRPVTP